MEDTLALEASAERCAGSTPVIGTMIKDKLSAVRVEISWKYDRDRRFRIGKLLEYFGEFRRIIFIGKITIVATRDMWRDDEEEYNQNE